MTTWAGLIRDLKSHGLTLAEIGGEIGLAVSSVSDLANGRTRAPGGDAAVKLQFLHASRCRKAIAKKRRRVA